jgi:hypothetical protein
VPYVRTVKTGSGAMAVQVVWSSRQGSREIEHIGSAHDEGELEALKAAARQRMAAGQGELDLGLEAGAGAGGGPLAWTSGIQTSRPSRRPTESRFIAWERPTRSRRS